MSFIRESDLKLILKNASDLDVVQEVYYAEQCTMSAITHLLIQSGYTL